MARKNKKRFNILIWFGGVLLILAFLVALATLSGKQDVKEAHAALKAAGRPLTVEELVPPGIPDSQNAAVELESAVEQLKEEAVGDSDLFSELRDAAVNLLEDDPAPGALDEFRQLFESGAVAEALALIEDGILKDGYVNDLDFSQGINLELPHLSELMGLARILAATVKLQASDGDQAGAWDTALTSLRLANVLKDEPITISQVVRTSSMMLAINSIRSLDHSAAPSAHLSEIDGLLTSLVDPAPFVAAIDGERILAGEGLSNISPSELVRVHGRPPDLGTNIMIGAYEIIPSLRRRDHAAHTNAMREYAEALEQPFSESDWDLGLRIYSELPPYTVVARMTTPDLGSIKRVMTDMFAEANITRAGLAVQDYQRQYGTYPADLAALGREGLIDPYTGESLLYQSGDTGFNVYSVGSNLTDDTAGDSTDSLDDIIWQLPDTGDSS